MMTSTHALFGASIGAVATLAVPELAPAAIVVGFVGGALPDLDLLWTHRRTTHFPVYAPGIAVVAIALALFAGTSATVLFAVFAVTVAAHAAMDVLCGGVETRPWEATSERAVYDHLRGRWLRPRRLVRYAGAPEDLLLATGVALPALALTTDRLQTGLLAVLLVSGAFVAVRRRLASVTEWLFDGEAGDG